MKSIFFNSEIVILKFINAIIKTGSERLKNNTLN